MARDVLSPEVPKVHMAIKAVIFCSISLADEQLYRELGSERRICVRFDN
jgi:hypothetical protein